MFPGNVFNFDRNEMKISSNPLTFALISQIQAYEGSRSFLSSDTIEVIIHVALTSYMSAMLLSLRLASQRIRNHDGRNELVA